MGPDALRGDIRRSLILLHSLYHAPRALCIAPRYSLVVVVDVGGLCAGPRRSLGALCAALSAGPAPSMRLSAHAARGGRPQLCSACHPFNVAGWPEPMRRLPFDMHDVGNSDPRAGSRGPQPELEGQRINDKIRASWGL